MKKLALFLFSLCFSLFVQAQVSKTVNCTAGNLKTLLTATEQYTVTNLTLTGTIDARDFKTMRDNMTVLAVLDMAAVNIAAYYGTEGPGESVIYGYKANEIPVYAFSGMYYEKGVTVLTSVVMPSSITSIGSYAFRLCTDLTGTLTIPSSVTSIGENAFQDCKRLTGLTIPSSVKSIDDYAFWGCSGFSGSLIIPSSVTYIGVSAFYGCKGAFEVNPDNQHYSSLDGILYDKDKRILYQCPISKTGVVTIPYSVWTIETRAFEGCAGITGSLTIKMVKSIGSGAFLGCGGKFEVDSDNQYYSSLDGILYDKDKTELIQCSISKTGSLTIPTSVTSIRENAFDGCTGLTGSLIIPSSVTSIGMYAFDGCIGLTCLTIPSSINRINYHTFYGCRGLTSIFVECPNPAELFNGVFEGVNTTTCILYVPIGTIAAYKAANQWKDFKNIVEYTPTALNSTAKTPLEVKIENGQLAVSNIPKGLTLTVYNIQGVVVSSQKVTGTSVSVGLPCRGAYVVRVGEQSIKVVY